MSTVGVAQLYSASYCCHNKLVMCLSLQADRELCGVCMSLPNSLAWACLNVFVCSKFDWVGFLQASPVFCLNFWLVCLEGMPSLTNHHPLYLNSWFHSLLIRSCLLFRLCSRVAFAATTSWFCFPSLFLFLVGFVSSWVLSFCFSFS